MKTLAAELIEEVIHTRLFAAALALMLAQLLLAPATGAASLGHQARGVAAVGLWLSTVAGLTGAVFIGIRTIGGALRDGTAELSLTRPISRGQWVLGRALGALGATAIWSTLVLGAYLPAAAGYGWLDPGLLFVLFALTLQLWLVASWSMLLGALARPAIAATGAASLIFAGVFADEVLRYALETGAVPGALATVLYAAVPDLDLFDVQSSLAAGVPVDLAPLTWGAVYVLSTSALLVGLSARAVQGLDLRSAS